MNVQEVCTNSSGGGSDWSKSRDRLRHLLSQCKLVGSWKERLFWLLITQYQRLLALGNLRQFPPEFGVSGQSISTVLSRVLRWHLFFIFPSPTVVISTQPVRRSIFMPAFPYSCKLVSVGVCRVRMFECFERQNWFVAWRLVIPSMILYFLNCRCNDCLFGGCICL